MAALSERIGNQLVRAACAAGLTGLVLMPQQLFAGACDSPKEPCFNPQGSLVWPSLHDATTPDQYCDKKHRGESDGEVRARVSAELETQLRQKKFRTVDDALWQDLWQLMRGPKTLRNPSTDEFCAITLYDREMVAKPEKYGLLSQRAQQLAEQILKKLGGSQPIHLSEVNNEHGCPVGKSWSGMWRERVAAGLEDKVDVRQSGSDGITRVDLIAVQSGSSVLLKAMAGEERLGSQEVTADRLGEDHSSLGLNEACRAPVVEHQVEGAGGLTVTVEIPDARDGGLCLGQGFTPKVQTNRGDDIPFQLFAILADREVIHLPDNRKLQALAITAGNERNQLVAVAIPKGERWTETWGIDEDCSFEMSNRFGSYFPKSAAVHRIGYFVKECRDLALSHQERRRLSEQDTRIKQDSPCDLGGM